MSTSQSFSRRVGAFSSATLISRILGYIRDALVASFFGGGLVTDAFYAAFKVPNLFRRFLGEGSLTAAFVPVFTQVHHREGHEQAQKFLNSLLSGLLILLTVIVALGILFAPIVTKLVAWGFTRDPEKLALTTDLVRLTFPFLLVVSVAALLTAVLNSRGRFFIPALAPSGLSIAEIGFILFIATRMESPIYGLAVAAVVGGTIHLLWQIPQFFREGFRFRFLSPVAHPEVKTVLLLMLPTILGLCADQINSFVDQLCASFLRHGAITALYNSNRIMQLPLALFGIAVSSVALPSLSQAAAENNDKTFKSLISFSIRVSNFVLIPSLIGLIVLGQPIIQLLFEHGKFTPEYTRLTYWALAPYCIGLPAYSVVRVFATAFYAKKNTKTPVRIAIWAMVIHIIGNLALMPFLGVAGLALSTSLSSWFQAIFLFLILRKETGGIGGKKVLTSFLYGLFAGLGMGTLCYFLSFHVLAGYHEAYRVFVPICVGAGSYFLLSKLLKIEEYNYFINALKKKKIDSQK